MLEDLDYKTIDNSPLILLPKVVDGQLEKLSVLKIGTRTLDFSIPLFFGLSGGLGQRELPRPEILFLDCRKDILRRQFWETWHRHPLATDGLTSDVIDQEYILLAPTRYAADFFIDT